jgi:hypothetical protein
MNKYKLPKEVIPGAAARLRDALARRIVLRQAGLDTYTYGMKSGGRAIVCLCCGLGSSHPQDIERLYCGFCQWFHEDTPESPHRLRQAAEIQRAHDILTAVITGDVDIEMEDDQLWRAAADVLCWVLQHDHNDAFARNLANLEETIAEAGYELEDRGRPIPPEEQH